MPRLDVLTVHITHRNKSLLRSLIVHRHTNWINRLCHLSHWLDGRGRLWGKLCLSRRSHVLRLTYGRQHLIGLRQNGRGLLINYHRLRLLAYCSWRRNGLHCGGWLWNKLRLLLLLIRGWSLRGCSEPRLLRLCYH